MTQPCKTTHQTCSTHKHITTCSFLTATDINECNTNNGGCAQNCHNNAGSYYCSCNDGYYLAGNGKNCNGELVCII